MRQRSAYGIIRTGISAVLLGALFLNAAKAHAAPQYELLCRDCHAMPPLDSASGGREPGSGAVKGSHQRHAQGSAASCARCHGTAVLSYGSGHRSRSVEMRGDLNGSPLPASYSRPFVNQTSLPPATLGTCSNVNCHFESATPSWGSPPFSASADCGRCHSTNPPSGSHPGKGGGHAPYGCATCHPSHDTFSHATSQRLSVGFSGGSAGGSYSGDLSRFLPSQSAGKSYGSCTKVYCHSDGRGSYSAPQWGNPSTGGCGSCHGTFEMASKAHPAHLSAAYGPQLNGGGTPASCQGCHSYAAATHVDGAVQSSTASCSTSCHRNGVPSWGGGRVSCESCHTGNLSVINGITAPYQANFTVTGHGQPGYNYNASRSCSSCHDGNTPHISTSPGRYQRIARNDNTLCSSCHDDAAKVPTAAKRGLPSHVAARFGAPTLMCTTCHDPHGTVNAASIRTRIVFGNRSGAISYNGSASQLVQNSPPYKGLCQVCHSETSHYRAGAAEVAHTMINNWNGECLSCHRHGDTFAFRPHGGTMTNIIYLKDASGNYLTTTQSGAGGKFTSLPPFSAANTCGPCHKEIVANEHQNYHADLGASRMTGRNSDPARPWSQGGGTVGRWCPGANRQLADLKATYASEAEFLAKVDLGVYQFVRECGICHVGGGVAVNNPFGFTGWLTADGKEGPSHTRLDDAGRSASLALDAAQGSHGRVPLNPWDFYVENGSVRRADWSGSGVLDQDCLVCHLTNYDLQRRNEQVARYGNFAKAAASGVFFAANNSSVAGPNSFDYPTQYVHKDAANRLYLDGVISRYYINKTPSRSNCAACHMPTELSTSSAGFLAAAAVPSSDPANPDPLVAANRKPARLREGFLTRGDTAALFMHFASCEACHTSLGETSGDFKMQAWDPVGNRGGDASRYLHSPGIGSDHELGASSSRETVRTCEECHNTGRYYKGDGSEVMIATFGSPTPSAQHHLAGLDARIVPGAMRIKDGTGTVETFRGSHLDVLSCTACHLARRTTAARSFDFSTGGEFVNLVGNPTDQSGTATVPLAFSWKDTGDLKVFTSGKPNSYWRRQIFPFNYVTAVSWNNIGSADANGDGFVTGQLNNGVSVSGDPFFSRTVKSRFSYGYLNQEKDAVPSGLANDPVYSGRGAWGVANQSGGVAFTRPGEIDAFQAAMASADPGYRPQLTLAAEPYLVSHNLGAPLGTVVRDPGDSSRVLSYGCADCHNGGEGVFNGSYDLLGSGRRISDGASTPITVSWSDPADVKATARGWDRDLGTLVIDFTDPATRTTRVPARGEFLGYDAARVEALNAITDPAAYGIGIQPVPNIDKVAGMDASEGSAALTITQSSTPVAISAKDAGSGGYFSYTWLINDGGSIPAGQSTSYAFTKTGTYTLYLGVTDEEGNYAVTGQKINVVLPDHLRIDSLSTDPATKITTFQLTIDCDYTYVQYSWGDGSTSTRNYDADGTQVQTHQYSRFAKYQVTDADPNTPGDQPGYRYTTTLSLYNGATWVQNKNVTVHVLQ